MMNFTNNNQPIIIGIDHGYGNCKTRNCCFKSGVAVYDKEPTFKENMLVYNGKYYLILPKSSTAETAVRYEQKNHKYQYPL